VRYIIRKADSYRNETQWMNRACNAQVFPNVARAYKAQGYKLARQGEEIVDLSTGRTLPEPVSRSDG